jgi:hypothetical protein
MWLYGSFNEVSFDKVTPCQDYYVLTQNLQCRKLSQDRIQCNLWLKHNRKKGMFIQTKDCLTKWDFCFAFCYWFLFHHQYFQNQNQKVVTSWSSCWIQVRICIAEIGSRKEVDSGVNFCFLPTTHREGSVKGDW